MIKTAHFLVQIGNASKQQKETQPKIIIEIPVQIGNLHFFILLLQNPNIGGVIICPKL